MLTNKRIKLDIEAGTKKSALEYAAGLLSEASHYKPQPILDLLIERERLGSTYLGYGIAIPHARIKNIKHSIGCFCRLSHKIDYSGGQYVDIIFAMILADHDLKKNHELLSKLTTQLNRSTIRNQLKHSQKTSDISKIFNTTDSRHKPS